MPATVLYISYNSLTDQLAQSQVLPYLTELGKQGYKFILISCEKKEPYEKEKAVIEKLCSDAGIKWQPLFYHTGLSVFSKFIDVKNIKALAMELAKTDNYTIVHCRSYIASLAGLYLKQKLGVKFIFDSREFWADEQVENGSWNLKNPLYRLIYGYFKKKEKQFATFADAVVNLSNNGKKIFCSWYPQAVGKTYVVPCVADFEHFKPNPAISKKELRQQMGLPAEGKILVHLGALAPNYLVQETIDFFIAYQQKYPGAVLLVLNKTQQQLIAAIAEQKQLDKSKLIVKGATRSEVPDYLSCCDAALCFMIPCQAKKSASPIKIGEYAAINLPVVATDVGDVKDIYEASKCGVVVESFNAAAYQSAISALEKIDSVGIRDKMQPYFNLPAGVGVYRLVYEKIEKAI